MRLPGYGVLSPEVIDALLKARFGRVEQHCRDWCERPSRTSLRPLARALGGMALLSRLCRQPASSRHARRAMELLRDRQTVPDRVVVLQCLVLLDDWTGRPAVQRHWHTSLVPLRDAALGALRQPMEDGAALPAEVHQYLILRECLTGRRPAARSAVPACRRLLADEPVLQQAARRFADDMALALDAQLGGLGCAGGSPENRRGALHALYHQLSVLAAAQQLRCLLLPAQALRQALWLIMLHLRHHPGDWPEGSLAVLVRHLLALQWWLRTGPEGGALDLSPVMRQTGVFLRTWQRAPGPGDEASPWLDGAVRRHIRQELREDLYSVSRELCADGQRPVHPGLCTALARMHLTLHLTGYRLLAWWCDSLQQSLLVRLQSGHPVGMVWRRWLLQFRRAVLAGPVHADTSGPDPVSALDHGRALLEAVTEEARLLTGQWQNLRPAVPLHATAAARRGADGVREPACHGVVNHGEGSHGEGSVIDQLSGGMTRLPDPAAWFDVLEGGCGSTAAIELIRSVIRELAVLENGARVLGVARIEALASVLRSVYRQIAETGVGEDASAAPDSGLLVALRRGHAGLLHRLDQAAAWQPISRPQPIIEYLYRCLEARQCGRPGNGLSLPQRCLSINRRLQALLDQASPAAVSDDRRTLMVTLMHDQARLLKFMTTPDRNRKGQGV